MDWQVSRPSDTLWRLVRQLQADPGSTLFYDIVIYCSDGALPWNRLCLALSLPSCAVVLDKDSSTESEVSVSLPDFTVWQAKEVLETCLPKESESLLHPSLIPSSASYTLVPHQEEEEQENHDEVPFEEEDDFYAGDMLEQSGYESDVEAKPSDLDKEKKTTVKSRKKQVEKKQSRNDSGVLVSNDLADYVQVECQICGVRKPMTFLRGHTKSAHNLTITDYKEKFGAELEPVEEVLHCCELCEEHVILDSDHIAVHLKKPGHSITHKNYNETYMADTRTPGQKEARAVKREHSFIKEEPMEEMPTGKRKRKRKMFHDDYELALALSLGEKSSAYEIAMAMSSGDAVPRKNINMEDIKNMKQLWKDAKVSVMNYKVTEEEIDIGTVELKPEELEDFVKMEITETLPRIAVDSSHGRPEEEEVENHISRFRVGNKIQKECNICHYTTDRSDATTMREHMHSHFPDICGLACPVCRKTEKRIANLMRHIESHPPEVLVLFGIEYIKQYEVKFDSNSEEQINLRSETYCKIKCGCCKQTFYSAERMNLHIEMDVCKFVENPVIRQKPKPKINPETGEPEYLARKKRRENLAESSDSEFDSKEGASDDEDEDFDPYKEQKKAGGQGGAKGGNSRGSYSTEQLSIDINIEGLLESLRVGGAPYQCVIPTCDGKAYPTSSSLRRHYVTHDPEMYAMLVCPICKFMKMDDHPGDMRNHIVERHDKTKEWADENVVLDISEKMVAFKQATQLAPKRGRKKGPSKTENGSPKSKKKNRDGSQAFSKCSVSLDDPLVRASFESGGVGGEWTCGLADCDKTVNNSYDLKRHYGLHDVTLRKNYLECNFCPFTAWTPKKMYFHLEEEHPDVSFLIESGEKQYKEFEGEGWATFGDAVNDLLENNPNNFKKRRWEEPEFDTIQGQCKFCTDCFNTQNSLEDHDKIHRPHLITMNCPHCQEGFAVESVYINHVRSHSILYEHFTGGVIRCNGCSRNFSKVKEVKSHLSIYHMNLLENCDFCEHCSDFFTTKQALKTHMFEHAEEIFRCPVCPAKMFLTQEEAALHMAANKCKDVSEFTCSEPNCGKVCNTKQNLKQHRKHSHNEKVYQYQCNICQTLYHTRTLMGVHVRKTHKVPKGESIASYFKYYKKEEALLLDVERLNAKKPKGRSGQSDIERLPCSWGCGGRISKSQMKNHKKHCPNRADHENEERVEFDGEYSQDSPFNSQDYQYSFPINFTKTEHV